MSDPRYIYPRNRLADMVDLADGMTIADALSRAHDNLDAVHEECATSIDALIDRLHGMLAQSDVSPTDDTLLAMYQLSNDIVGIAATLELRDVSRAAYSLCELIDRQRGRGSWSPRSALVHVEALQLLREPDGDAAGRQSILSGLEQVLNFAR